MQNTVTAPHSSSCLPRFLDTNTIYTTMLCACLRKAVVLASMSVLLTRLPLLSVLEFASGPYAGLCSSGFLLPESVWSIPSQAVLLILPKCLVKNS